MSQSIIIYGAGGHGRVVAEAAEAAGMTVLGFYDDYHRPGDVVHGYPVIEQFRHGVLCGLGIGDNDKRHAICLDRKLRCPTIIHDTAVVSDSAALHEGVFVSAGAIVQGRSVIKMGAIANTGSIVEHDAIIGECAHIAPGAVVLGGASVGARALVGANAVVLPNATVPCDHTVKAGTVFK